MREIICFHNPAEPYGFLSNWYLSDFTCGGFEYSSAEQYMMHRKALYFGDAETAAKILQTTDVEKIKALGRATKGYDDTIWNGVRQVIVYNGLLEKFRQNAELREKLLSTGDAILAECAVHDTIWGIGLSMWDSSRFDMSKWRGRGLLGFSLMLVRDRLRAEK